MPLLFDLDDTLIDDLTTKNYYLPRLYNQFKEFINYPEDEFRARWCNSIPIYYRMYLDGLMSFEDQRRQRVIESFGNENLTLPFIIEVVAAFDKYLNEGWQLFPKAIEVLEYFKDLKLGLITNGSSKQQNGKIDLLGIRKYFDCIIISEEVNCSKPDSKIFQIASERLSCKEEECIFIGDSWENDIVGASQAGMKPIWLNRNGLNIPTKIPNLTMIKEIEELMELQLFQNKLTDEKCFLE